MTKKTEPFNTEMLLKATKLLESGITMLNVCKHLEITLYTFEAICRIQPELKEVYERTKKLRANNGMQKAPSESQLNESVYNLGYKDRMLALCEFRLKFKEENRQIMLKNLKDPYY